MELWQMDVMGRVHLGDGSEMKLVTGIDDHSRFVVCAKAVARATARPVCAALGEALVRHGVPEQILTDNGKVFTARFGLGPGPVMFDKLCHDNGIKHLLTAPYSPTTTGKIEQLQAALDRWVVEYNTERPHQSCGGRPPVERFALAERAIVAVEEEPVVVVPAPRTPPRQRPAGVSRWVNGQGRISLAGFDYAVGATFAGEPVEVVVSNGLVEILHAGVATHVQRLKADQSDRIAAVPRQRRARDATTGLTVTRLADNSGVVSFAGSAYHCGRRWARQAIEVSIVAGSVQLAKGGNVIRIHPIRHDRSRELGAFANPKGRPRRKAPA